MSDYLDLPDGGEGKLFIRWCLNPGERRVARYHRFTLAGRDLKFPCFADPEPERFWREVGLLMLFRRTPQGYSPPETERAGRQSGECQPKAVARVRGGMGCRGAASRASRQTRTWKTRLPKSRASGALMCKGK